MMNEKQDGHPEEALSAYLDGELEPAERAAIEEHLQGCAACADLLEDLRVLDAAAAEELPPPVPADLAGRISRQLAPPRVVEMPERRWAVKRWFGPIPLAAAATLAAVAILATVRLVAPLAVRGPAAPVPVTDEALRPVPKEKSAEEDRDAAREHRTAGEKGAASQAARRDAGAPTQGAVEIGASAEEGSRLSGQEKRAVPADAATGERESTHAQRVVRMQSPAVAPIPKREKGQGAATPSAGAAAPEPVPSAPSEPDLRPGAAAPLRDAALEESAASEDDEDTARSLAAPERFGAKPTEPGTLSVLGETEGPREVRMLRTGAVAQRTLILETPGYRISVTEDGDLEVHAPGYRCAVAAETPAEEGRRAAGEFTSARPVAKQAVGVPAEIADLFRLASLLREASEKEDSREDRSAAKEAAESPWAVSLIEPETPLLRVDVSADWNLMGADPLADSETRRLGNVATTRAEALQNETTRRYLAAWLAERIQVLARRDYANLLRNQCGPLPDSLAPGN